MFYRYEDKSYMPKANAQANLCGRTHYVDDDTLKFHKARIISARPYADGLLFGLVESVALDPDGRERGFRYVIFDLCGNVCKRPNLEDSYKTRGKAAKELAKELEIIDAKEITHAAIAHQKRVFERAIEELHRLAA